MIPRELLPIVLDRFFPMVSGPEELDLVIPRIDQRGEGDFCGCVQSDAEMVAASCARSFLPMSEDQTGFEVLLIKAHEVRSVLEFDDIVVGKSTVRRSRGLRLRVDVDFERCLYEAIQTHEELGRGRWLTDSLCAALIELHDHPRFGVQARSFEVYSDGERIAGEVGYSCGRAYTSMSGYYLRSGAGSVQLAALSQLLRESGFAFWDLGMELDYKHDLGAHLMDRDDFATRYVAAASEPAPDLPPESDCHDLVRQARGVTVAGRAGMRGAADE